MRTTLLTLAMAGALATGTASAGDQPAPVFPDLEFVGVDGGSVRLSQLKGNVVLLNVWATWCGPCKLELPDRPEDVRHLQRPQLRRRLGQRRRGPPARRAAS